MSDDETAEAETGADAEPEPEPEPDADEPDAAVAGDTEESEPETDDGLANGDFVRIEYTVRTVESDRVVDTTSEEVAEEAGIDDEDHEFSPRTIVVGAGHVFEAVDRALEGSHVGDEASVRVPAAEAFGEVDPDEVRTVSAEKIPEDDRYPGAQVRIDGDQGHVETIIGGRARVDFNHPLAGEALDYEYEIVEAVTDRVEKARGLLGMYLQQAPEVSIETEEIEEEVEVEEEGDGDDEGEPATETRTVERETLYIEATPGMTMNQQWLFQKGQIANQLMARLDVDRVVVQETFDGGGMGMGTGMGGMMGGAGGGGADDVEAALEDVDVDADELVDELGEE
jgi:FKBP-type peptidyl-prolyl cis-trans isomerase SlyD